jgi:arylsulfatase A-like enzyme
VTDATARPGSPFASLLEAGLLGVVVFGTAGLLEVGLLSRWVRYADAWREAGASVLAYAVLGAGVGGAFGLVTAGSWSSHWRLHRTWLLAGSLAASWLGLALFVHARDPAGPLLAKLATLAATPLLVAAAVWLARRRGRRADPGRPSRAPLASAAGALLAAGWLLPHAPPGRLDAGADQPPNVLLIVMDTTRYDRLSLHGYAHETTPALDRIARESAVFTRAYASAPWTLPSHASIFTGLYPGEHGATSEHTRLDPEIPTLAERLAGRGLLPVAISKKTWLSSETGMFRGFAHVFDLYAPPRRPALLEGARQLRFALRERPPDKGAREVTETAITWLERHGHRPFFLFVNYNETHSDLFPPTPFRERFLADLADTPWGRSRFPDMVAADLGHETYTAEEYEILSRLYDASVAYQDWRMAQLFDFLRAGGLLDETLLVVTSDHGENLGEHGMLGHNLSMANTLLHVPLIVRHPRLVPAGLVIDEPVEIRRIGALVDLVLSRSDRVPLAAGELVGALSGRPDGAVIAEAYRPLIRRIEPAEIPDEPRFHRRRKSVVLDELKYVWSSDGADELYDLGADPDEDRNLAAERAADRERLRRILEAEPGLWREGDLDPQLGLSEEAQEQLREMGYLPKRDEEAP